MPNFKNIFFTKVLFAIQKVKSGLVYYLKAVGQLNPNPVLFKIRPIGLEDKCQNISGLFVGDFLDVVIMF